MIAVILEGIGVQKRIRSLKFSDDSRMIKTTIKPARRLAYASQAKTASAVCASQCDNTFSLNVSGE